MNAWTLQLTAIFLLTLVQGQETIEAKAAGYVARNIECSYCLYFTDKCALAVGVRHILPDNNPNAEDVIAGVKSSIDNTKQTTNAQTAASQWHVEIRDRVVALLLEDLVIITQTFSDAARYPYFARLSEARKVVLYDLMYTLGPTEFAKLTGMIDALRAGDWAEAASQLKSSLLQRQCPRRKVECAKSNRRTLYNARVMELNVLDKNEVLDVTHICAFDDGADLTFRREQLKRKSSTCQANLKTALLPYYCAP